MRILIVDDNAEQAEVLQKLLKLRFDPKKVFVVNTMRGAREIIQRNNLDAIVLDLLLPDSSIEKTIEEIRSMPYPVYVYTGYDDPLLRQKVLLAGAEDFIVKSTNSAGIIERIAHLQYKRSQDSKLLVGAYSARLSEAKANGFRSTIPRLVAAVITVVSFAGGIVMGGWGFAKSQGAAETNLNNHFVLLDASISELKRSNDNQDTLIKDLYTKSQQSADNQASSREQNRLTYETITDWLKRIENKLERNNK